MAHPRELQLSSSIRKLCHNIFKCTGRSESIGGVFIHTAVSYPSVNRSFCKQVIGHHLWRCFCHTKCQPCMHNPPYGPSFFGEDFLSLHEQKMPDTLRCKTFSAANTGVHEMGSILRKRINQSICVCIYFIVFYSVASCKVLYFFFLFY